MKRIPPSEVMKQGADAILEGYLEEGPPLEALARLGARYMLQVALEEEVTAFLGRGHYQHGSRPRGDPGLPHARAGWRNGYQPVALRGPDGKWELFRPKVRATKEPFRSTWAHRIRLGREDLQALVTGMYVRGLSTRDIQDLYTQVFGQPVLSKSQVSRIAARLGPAFDQWRKRDLSHLKVVYLFLDGNYHAVRQGTSEKEGILCAYGITEEGKKVLIHLALGSRESYDAWLAFLHDLTSRGLKEPLLIIADGNPGLRKAVRQVFSGAYFQRCLVHKMRNILAKLPKGAMGAIKPLLQQVFYAENQALAHRRARSLIRRFEGRFPFPQGSCKDGHGVPEQGLGGLFDLPSVPQGASPPHTNHQPVGEDLWRGAEADQGDPSLPHREQLPPAPVRRPGDRIGEMAGCEDDPSHSPTAG